MEELGTGAREAWVDLSPDPERRVRVCVPEEKLGELGGPEGCHCWATGCGHRV